MAAALGSDPESFALNKPESFLVWGHPCHPKNLPVFPALKWPLLSSHLAVSFSRVTLSWRCHQGPFPPCFLWTWREGSAGVSSSTCFSWVYVGWIWWCCSELPGARALDCYVPVLGFSSWKLDPGCFSQFLGHSLPSWARQAEHREGKRLWCTHPVQFLCRTDNINQQIFATESNVVF